MSRVVVTESAPAESGVRPGLRPWLPTPETAPLPEAEVAAPRGVDRRNLALIVLGGLALLLLLPPQHEFPVIDDWIYAGSVQHQLLTGTFVMPSDSQANLAGLTLWGTLWARLFGFSYTTLTWSTLSLALLGLLAFYGLARRVGVPPAGALLGTALLAANPLFLHLSYSFMTDVPFLALVLAACYAYVRGLQTGPGSVRWLWIAGLLTAWAFTIRQFAILVPFGFLAYLLLAAAMSRRWAWRPALAILALPLLTVAGWWLWTHDWPEASLSVQAAARRNYFLFTDAWARVFLLRILAALPLTALMAWTAMRLRPVRWWLAGLWTALLALAWVWVNGLSETWINVTVAPAVARLGTISFPLPAQIDTFLGDGNIIRVGGFDFYQYRQAPIWTPEIWGAVFVGASVLAVLLLAKLSDGLIDWVRDRRRGRAPEPLLGVYLAGLAIFVVSLALAGDFYDRYLLGFAPFVILFAVRGARHWSRRAWAYSLSGLTVLALWSLLLQRDFVAHDNARWAAGDWLLARVAPVQVGFDWNNIKGFGNGTYEVTDIPITDPAFRTERVFPYDSWLSGFTTRLVLAQARADMPPLPAK